MMNTTTKYFIAILGFACIIQALPLLGIEDELDSAIVESTIREVRAVKDSEEAPANFHHTYDSGDKGDKGYTRQKSDKGKTGYQKFDSFHKKGGDSYGYEKHDSFGLEGKKGAEGSSGKSGHSGKSSHDENAADDESAGHVASPDDSSSYEVVEDSEGDYESADENVQDGGDSDHYYDGEQASEAEGGIEGAGYDESDSIHYTNPSSYAYGSGNEYDF